ncbi:unnamed protein product, partial [Didymodactylos carnosus]
MSSRGSACNGYLAWGEGSGDERLGRERDNGVEVGVQEQGWDGKQLGRRTEGLAFFGDDVGDGKEARRILLTYPARDIPQPNTPRDEEMVDYWYIPDSVVDVM